MTDLSDGAIQAKDEEYARAIAFRDKQYKYGFSDLLAHDCSGFLSWLMRETGIWDSRRDCDGLWSLCDVVARNELIAGDFLFRNSSTNAEDETHIGLHLGSGKVVHDKGRDVRCCCRGDQSGRQWLLAQERALQVVIRSKERRGCTFELYRRNYIRAYLP